MPPTSGPATAPERVLSTLNLDGSRRWLRPRPSPGRFLRWRADHPYRLVGPGPGGNGRGRPGPGGR